MNNALQSLDTMIVARKQDGTELTHEQLKAVFDIVCDPIDWKEPIDFTGDLHEEDIEVAEQAITFFTATTATVTRQANGEVTIKSKGYRRGPAC